MHYLSHVQPEDLKDKRVLVRLDLNVPLSDDGTVHSTDADRIRKSLSTIRLLKNAGARVIVISHIGRDPKETLAPVAKFFATLEPVDFFPALVGDDVAARLADLQSGGCIILENLRSNPGEEANDPAFAATLASYADIYVNDAFAVSHRAHASVVGTPHLLPAYAGLQMEQEIEHLSQAFHPEHPSIVVLGGAKFETKLPVIQKFLGIADTILVGGALANNFYKEMGHEVGSSLLDETADIKNLIGNPKILLPQIVVVENEQGREEKAIADVIHGDKIVDAAPAAIEAFSDTLLAAKFIMWNGPLGNYENGFVEGSQKLAHLIQEAGQAGAQSIVGGGDSVALVEQLGLEKDFGFLSTGGGAMLEYLANGTLPGIEALA